MWFHFSSSHIWMWELEYKESGAPKIDAFELWCWRRLLRVPWTARRSNQSILKESVLGVHWKDWGWSWNSSTLATWCEELTHWKRPWCWERLRTGGEGDDRGWDGWMASPTLWTRVSASSGSWWWTWCSLACCDSRGHKESDMTEQLNWNELILYLRAVLIFSCLHWVFSGHPASPWKVYMTSFLTVLLVITEYMK